MLFSLGNQLSRRALVYASAPKVTLCQIGVSVTMYWLAAPFYMKAAYWLTPAILVLVVAGLIRPLISANLGTQGTRILGPTISSTMGACGPLISVTLGVVFLAETLRWQTAIGTLGIAISIVVLTWRGNNKPDWPLWALLFPLGATTIRATSHALAKFGLESIPSPIFVALVAYTVSFPLAFLYMRYRERDQTVPPVPRRGYGWMLLSGSCYGTAVLMLNTALMWSDLVVVSPIIACTPFFTLLLGIWVFRESEVDRRSIIAVALVVPSVILIGI